MQYHFSPDIPIVTEQEDGTKVAEFVLGYDLDLDTIVYEQIILVRGESHLHGRYWDVFDLQFGIREKLASAPSTVSCLDYSTISAKRFVPDEHRHWVMQRVLECVEELVKKFTPASITMQTYHANVPPKGMQKYSRISDLLRALGYIERQNFRGTDGIWFYVNEPRGNVVVPMARCAEGRLRPADDEGRAKHVSHHRGAAATEEAGA